MNLNWKLAAILVSLAGLWWLLSGGEMASWLIGLPATLAAGWSAQRLKLEGRGVISLLGLIRFTPFFLWESLRGGVDVALRTLAPRMRISPGFSVYRTELRREDARVFFVNCVSLLPGTLAARLSGERLDLHLLDTGSNPDPELHRLEMAVARVYPDSYEARTDAP